MSKNWSLKETELSYDQKCACLDNPRQNIWNKIEKSSKIGPGKKSLISTFAYFLTAITKVQFLDGRLGTRLCLHFN